MKNLHNDTSLRLFLFNAKFVHYQTGIATNNNLVTLHQAITLTHQLSECSVLVTALVPGSCHIRYERYTRLVVHFRIVPTGLLWRSTGLIAHVHFKKFASEVPDFFAAVTVRTCKGKTFWDAADPTTFPAFLPPK